MTPAQKSLVGRIRAATSDKAPRREVAMFGGLAFMINEKMIVSAGKDGNLLARVPAADHEQLLETRGAAQAEMGTGRSMGPGWITVTADHLIDDDDLAFWISIALSHNETSTRKN